MADLKELLGKYVDGDKLDTVIEELNQELPKSYIPKARFNEVNEKYKVTESALEELKKSNEALQTKVGSLDEYEKQLNELKQKNETIEKDYQVKLSSVTKQSQFKELLLESGIHKQALDLIVEKYLPEVELENGTIKGQNELLAKLKAERSELFVTKVNDSDDKGGKGKQSNEDEEQARLKRLFGL